MLTDRQWAWIRAVLVPLLILAWFAVVFVAGLALSHVIREVILLVLAGVIAYAISPLVGMLRRRFPRLPRPIAITISYLIGFAIIFTMLGFVGYTATTQIAALVRNLPGYFNQAQHLEPTVLSLLKGVGVGNEQLIQARDSLLHDAQSAGSAVASGALSTITKLLDGIVDAIVALLLSVYLTANGPRIELILENAGRGVGWGRRVSGFIRMFNQVLGGYVRGTLTLALLVGVLVTILMFCVQVPYAILLGVIAFFMEFIPVIGVFISGAICVLITLGTGGLIKAIIVLAGFVALHFIEGEFVGPRIMGKAVGIHPAVSLIALIAGTDLFGIWGALFASPAAGLLQAFGIAGWREFRRSDLIDPPRQEPGAPRHHKVPPPDDSLAAAADPPQPKGRH